MKRTRQTKFLATEIQHEASSAYTFQGEDPDYHARNRKDQLANAEYLKMQMEEKAAKKAIAKEQDL